MEGNIYNKIYDEIKVNLPDINFDSDSDDLEKNEPIKPYIRPAAEILFGWDDQESQEILEILSKMPTDSTIKSSVKTVCNHEVILKDHSPTEITEKLPFMNIDFPNGIQNHIPEELSDDEGRIILPNFGVHNNMDLDKVLEDMDLSSYKSDFFENVLTDTEVIEEDERYPTESMSTLLTRLDEMSKVYEESHKNTNNNNKSNTTSRIYLSNLFNQLKHESSAETVLLDLRIENKLWSAEIDQKTKTNFSHQINEIIREESSDEESEINDNKDEDNKDLWIDSYRRYKASIKVKLSYKSEDVVSESLQPKINDKISTIQKVEDKSELNIPDKKEDVTIVEDKSIPKDIQIKLDRIKHREKVLSDRRLASLRLEKMLPVSEDCPLLFHEDASFDALSYSLLHFIENDSDKILYFIANMTLSSSSAVLTMSKIPSPISDKYPNENFAASLVTLLQFTNVSTIESPFIVIGLQQTYYENKVQLSLLCKTKFSLTKLKLELKKLTLRKVLKEENICNQLISDLPLSNILQILPYNAVLNGNIWAWNNSSIIWKKLDHKDTLYNDHNNCRPLNINTSCVVIEEVFYLSDSFYNFILKLLERGIFSGIRLIYHSDGKKQLVLAVRGYDSINNIKTIQNKMSLYKDSVWCTRFRENSSKELVKYFGPRLDPIKITTMLQDNHDRNLAIDLSEGLSLYHTLHCNKPSDIIILVSPVCIDIGWVINTLWSSGGYLLVNMARIDLTISSARQLGINEQLIDNFECTNGICHVLILRNENPMHSIKYHFMRCGEVIQSHGDQIQDVDQIFYSIPYSNSILTLLNLQRIYQTPSIRELAVPIIECPYEDCEQCSFVLLISDELTRHVAQLLDQMSNLDLLAVKCMKTWPSQEHLALIQTQFKLRLPKINVNSIFEETEGKMRIAVIVVRSMFLIKELEKIQSTIRMEKNLIFAYTMNVTVTFEMIGSFFTSSDLLSDFRRRSVLQFLPEGISSKLPTLSILAQFPLIYSSISTVLSMSITDPSIVLTKFQYLWFLLTREGFEMTDVHINDIGTLVFFMKRPNAIFYLIQWAKTHFDNDKSIKIASNAEEIEDYISKTTYNKETLTIKSLTFYEDETGVIFIMIDESFLDSSPEVMRSSKIFWTYLKEQGYNCIGLSLKKIEGADMFKLNDVSLKNLYGNQIKKEGCYLCLLMKGSMISSVFEDLLKCKLDLHRESLLKENIYLCCDNHQIIKCCNTILKGFLCNKAEVNVSYYQ